MSAPKEFAGCPSAAGVEPGRSSRHVSGEANVPNLAWAVVVNSDKPRSKQTQIERVEAYFSAGAREWEDLYSRPRRVNDFVLANRRKLAVQLIASHVPTGARILDAGCGAGLVALDLLQQGFFVHAVDLAAPMLDLARRRFESAGVATNRYALTLGDLEIAELEPASFGGIVALGFLEYQADEVAMLKRLNHLLAPGGTLIVSGPTKVRLANYLGLSTRIRNALLELGLTRPRATPYRVGLHRYSPKRYRDLLESAGLEFVKAVGHGFVEFEGPLRRLSYAGELALHRTLSIASSWIPISRWGNDMIAVGRKPK
jgi:2-polyprenyl-3-methyl-5-hydroxy-6-metoxy-1,4-benzoquinol methylase